MRELLEYVVKALVDQPEQVFVNQIVSEHSVILELKVAKEDIGKIIGKQGRTVQALRTILNAASGKGKTRVTLELLD